MKPDEIFAKVNDGSLHGEELTNAVAALEIEEAVELKKKFADATREEYGKVSAFRQEKQRLETLVTERKAELEKATPPPITPTATPETSDVMKQFREEQKQKAIRKFITDYGITEDEKNRILELHAKMDSGKVDADNIYEDLVGVYAFVNKDRLVEAEKERKAREAAAAAAAAQAAGGAPGAPTGIEPPKFSEVTQSLAKQAGITPEAADKIVKEGTVRVFK